MLRKLIARRLIWGGISAAAAAVALWVCLGPDSVLQNLVLDRMRARYAHGRLTSVSDQARLGRRCPVLLVLGANMADDPDGPSSDRAEMYVETLWRDLGDAYKDSTGRELDDDAKLYCFWYNSSDDDRDTARSLGYRIEAEPDLTRAHVRIAAGGHSKGANVLFIYWCQGGRKLRTKFSLAGPQLGTPLADPAELRAGMKTAFPVIGGLVWALALKRSIEFETPGMQWLTPDYPPLIELRRAHPLDASWWLFAGKLKPLSAERLANEEDLARVVETSIRDLLSGDNMGQYQIGSMLLDSLGQAPSDGIVPLRSALCEGYRGAAHTAVLEGYDHSEMLYGNGSGELATKVLTAIGPDIASHAQP